jgi:hypothetical protein
MHKAFAQRLARLEKERAQLGAPTYILAFRYIKPDKTPVEAIVATDQKGFTCQRNKDEPLDAFEVRAIEELRALHPFGPPRMLIFSDEEPKEEPPHAA